VRVTRPLLLVHFTTLRRQGQGARGRVKLYAASDGWRRAAGAAPDVGAYLRKVRAPEGVRQRLPLIICTGGGGSLDPGGMRLPVAARPRSLRWAWRGLSQGAGRGERPSRPGTSHPPLCVGHSGGADSWRCTYQPSFLTPAPVVKVVHVLQQHLRRWQAPFGGCVAPVDVGGPAEAGGAAALSGQGPGPLRHAPTHPTPCVPVSRAPATKQRCSPRARPTRSAAAAAAAAASAPAPPHLSAPHSVCSPRHSYWNARPVRTACRKMLVALTSRSASPLDAEVMMV
jgi:hypothetical protein